MEGTRQMTKHRNLKERIPLDDAFSYEFRA